MNRAYHKKLLDEQSCRLTQFEVSNTNFKRLLYGISIRPAAFSALMRKTFRSIILSKNVTAYLDDIFIQSQTKQERFKI